MASQFLRQDFHAGIDVVGFNDVIAHGHLAELLVVLSRHDGKRSSADQRGLPDQFNTTAGRCQSLQMEPIPRIFRRFQGIGGPARCFMFLLMALN